MLNQRSRTSYPWRNNAPPDERQEQKAEGGRMMSAARTQPEVARALGRSDGGMIIAQVVVFLSVSPAWLVCGVGGEASLAVSREVALIFIPPRFHPRNVGMEPKGAALMMWGSLPELGKYFLWEYTDHYGINRS